MKKLGVYAVLVAMLALAVIIGEFVFPQGGGYGWRQEVSGTDGELYGVCAVDGNTAWAVGGKYLGLTPEYDSYILKTTDGGNTWVRQKSGTDYVFSGVTAVDANTAWVAGSAWDGYSNPGAIFKTNNGGSSWTRQYYTEDDGGISDMWALDANTVWAVQGCNLLKTTNGGDDWGVVYTAGGYIPGIHVLDANTAWAVMEDKILKTTNGGGAWTTQYTDPSISFSAISAGDANNIWAVDGALVNAAIVKSTDGGDNWVKQYEQYWDFRDVEAVDADTAWVIDGGLNIFKTSDGGASWIHQEHGIAYTGYPLRDISACDANNAWTVGGLGIILHTRTGGALNSWYFAEGCTREGFEEWLCIQNPGAEEISVHAQYMLFGAVPVDRDYAVPAGSRASIRVNSEVGPGQDVSVKLTSEKEFYAERAMYFNYKPGVPGYSWDGGHVTFGARSPRSHWYFAEGCTRDGFEEWICIQNPSDTDAVAQIDYISAGAYAVHKEYSVSAHSRITAFVNSDMGPGQDVSAHVYTTGTPIVAERPMYFNYHPVFNPGPWNDGHIVMGTGSPGREWYFAEGCTRGGFEEWVCIQNPNPAPANLEVDYATSEGPVQKDYQIPANSRGTLNVNAELGQGLDVSCHILSDQDVICERPLYFNYAGYGAGNWNGGSDEVGVVSPALEWYFAEGCTIPNFQEWICVQNTGDETAAVEVTYNIQGGSLKVTNHQVPPGRYTIFVNNDAGPDLQLSCRLKSDKPIICERAMYFNFNGIWDGGHCAAGFAP